MNQPTLTYIVRATALVDEAMLEDEDRGVVGDHDIKLPAQAWEWPEGQQASAVLDAFHNSVAVGVLDDFTFSVIGPDGREIFEQFDD